jgi:peptidyl-prolyl cis-trans isomerase SurA
VRKPIALVLLALLAGAPLAAVAQDSLRIAAVVNDDVISALDLSVRERMVMSSSHLQDSPEARSRLAPQVLRGLIDERLKLQEAQRLGIKVPDKEVEQQVKTIATENKMSVQDFEAALQQSGILIDSLRSQIRAELAWLRVVQRRLRPNVTISDDQIDEAMAEIKANANQPQYLLAEIFLSVDTPAQEAEVRQSADRLIDQIHQGAGFSAVARQFSQSSTAAGGGDLGWVGLGQLDRALDAVLPNLKKGEVSQPIRSNGGFYILYLRDQRQGTTKAPEGKVTMKQAFLPVPANATQAQIDKASEQVQHVIDQAKSCDDMVRLARELTPNAHTDLDNVDYADLPPDLKQIATDQPLNTPSKPLHLATGIGAYMVCQRDIVSGGLPSRYEVGTRLLRERLEVMARGYLRDLRRAAFIDLRV